MNFNDELLDLLLKRDLILQRVSNGLSKDIAKDYLKMIDEAISIIGKSDITLVNMNKVIKEINDNININYPNIEDSLKEVSITESSYIPNSINALVGVDIATSKLSEPLINKIVKNSILSDGYTIKEGFEKLNENLQNTLQNQIRLGVLNGSTNQEIIRNLKPYMTDFTDNRVEAMVKTAISTVVNNTRMDTYKENEDIFKGYQHQSVLDSRTTFICAERDNKQWDLEYKPIGHKLPFKNTPIHYRCRSVILPITKSFKELGLNIDEVPIGTRSSLNGYVPANMSFTQWFDKQSPAMQEKYLGKGRYQLYKNGKISFSDLVNQKGQTLSIKELKGFSNVPVKTAVPKIDFGYGGKFNKYVENIRDEAKIVIDKLPKPKIKTNNKKIAYYDGEYINLLNDDLDKSIFLHEYGHHIDKSLKYSSDLFKDSFKNDLLSINIDTLPEKVVEIAYNKKTIDTGTRIKEKLSPKSIESDLFSDILDSITKGKLTKLDYRLSGHGEGYYQADGYDREEVFANLFSLWSAKSKYYDEIQKIMPNTVKEFEKILTNIK